MLTKSISLFIVEYINNDERIQLEDFAKKSDGLEYKIKIEENIINLRYTEWHNYKWLVASASVCPVRGYDDLVGALDYFSYLTTPVYSLSLDKYQMVLLMHYSLRAENLALDTMEDLTIKFAGKMEAIKSLLECEKYAKQ